MSDIATLLRLLDSADAAQRHGAALELMDVGNPIVIRPLLKAMAKPENANHRGTLVYVLGAFDCREHLSTLIELTLTGDFEVSTAAFGVIEGMSDVALARQISLELEKYDLARLPFEHRQSALKGLRSLATMRMNSDPTP